MKWVLLATGVAICFVGGCTLSIRPAWDWMERGWTETVGTEPPQHFPVLVRLDNGKGIYAVASYSEIHSEAPVVTEVTEADLPQINRDLAGGAGVGRANSNYFQVVDRGNDYLDVRLEAPAAHESKCVGWYRIRGSTILPQRILAYGPGFAFEVLRINLIVGIGCSLLFVLAWLLLLPARIKKETGGVTLQRN